MGIDPRGIDHLVLRGGLLQPSGIAALHGHKSPLLALLLPELSLGNVHDVLTGLPGLDFSLKNDLASSRLWRVRLNDVQLDVMRLETDPEGSVSVGVARACRSGNLAGGLVLYNAFRATVLP